MQYFLTIDSFVQLHVQAYISFLESKRKLILFFLD